MCFFFIFLVSRINFLGVKIAFNRSLPMPYNIYMETIAVNMFNIIDRFSRLIFHCYAANIVNVIDIVLFYFLFI